MPPGLLSVSQKLRLRLTAAAPTLKLRCGGLLMAGAGAATLGSQAAVITGCAAAAAAGPELLTAGQPADSGEGVDASVAQLLPRYCQLAGTDLQLRTGWPPVVGSELAPPAISAASSSATLSVSPSTCFV
jgi:hypothetical protein